MAGGLPYEEAFEQYVSSHPFRGSAGILGVGVTWAAIRDFGDDFTPQQWHTTRHSLVYSWDYCLEHALIQLRRGRKKFGNAWWRVFAFYNAGDRWRTPQAQAYARSAYRWWLVASRPA